MYQSIYSFQWTFSTLWTVMQVVALCKCSKQKPRKCTACRLRTIIRMLARVHHLSHTHTHSHTHTDTYASSAWAMYTVNLAIPATLGTCKSGWISGNLTIPASFTQARVWHAVRNNIPRRDMCISKRNMYLYKHESPLLRDVLF